MVACKVAGRLSVLLLGLAAVSITLLGTWTDIDLRLAGIYFNRRAVNFPWRHAWLTEQFSHVILKRTLVGLGAVMILLALWDRLRPLPWGPLQRQQVRVVAISAATVPLITSILKQMSNTHCPWDIDRFGGTAPYIRLLDSMPAGLEAGHCMPGGHASSALWLISFAVFCLPHRPRLACVTFGLMLGFGMAVGWLQQMRGAHFLTHTLWSAWIACAVFFVLLRWTPQIAEAP